MKRGWIAAGLVAIAAAIAVVVVVVRGGAGEPAFAVEAIAPRAAPALGYRDHADRAGTLAALEGKVVLVHFWGTWCPPCVRELPGLLATARQVGTDFVLLAIAIEDEWPDVEGFFHGDVPAEVVRPDDAAIHQRYDAPTLPVSFLVDARGRLVARYDGPRAWGSAEALSHLREITAASK